jgi:hypothetical protein
MDTEDGVGITVNVTGDPAAPTLVDAATETERLIGLVVRYRLTAAIITMAITTIARSLVRDKTSAPARLPSSLNAYCVFGVG